MTYSVGTFIDLSGISKKTAEVPVRRKKSYYQVGTQFVFRFTPAGLQAAIKIPVAFA